MRAPLLSLSVLLLSAALFGCASAGGSIDAPLATIKVSEIHSANDGHRVRVKGFAAPTHGGIYLFPDAFSARRQEFSKGIDLVQLEEQSRRVTGNGSCVVVSGVFLAFGKDSVGLGYLRSEIGIIELDGIEAVACQ